MEAPSLSSAQELGPSLVKTQHDPVSPLMPRVLLESWETVCQLWHISAYLEMTCKRLSSQDPEFLGPAALVANGLQTSFPGLQCVTGQKRKRQGRAGTPSMTGFSGGFSWANAKEVGAVSQHPP